MRPYSADSPWDFEPGLTFLTHGTFGACPRPIVERRMELIRELEANPIRFYTRDYEERFDAARREVAAFLGADPAGTVIVPNATTGVATVLESLRLRPGDELLTNDHEYNATLNALETVAARAKARVVRVSIPLPIRHPEEVVEAILRGVTPHTRLALISHVTSPSGLVFPIEAIVRELARLGVETLVDAAHAPGMVPVDVDALGAAYWTGNGHKWLCGPKSVGVLVVREDRRTGVLPLVTGHGRNDLRLDRPALWREFDWPGTADTTAFFALPEALRLIGGLQPGGWPAHMAANHALAIAGRQLLNDRLGLEPLAPESMIGAMASIRMPTVLDEDGANAIAHSLAAEERIEVPIAVFPVRAARAPGAPPSENLLRISAQRYNELADYELLADALVRRGLGRAHAVARGASAIVAG
ncbi:MAG TPA: aminotransferase class V-fold PLP-dependent enzyme [Candidatus Limnocylindrales bacterium]